MAAGRSLHQSHAAPRLIALALVAVLVAGAVVAGTPVGASELTESELTESSGDGSQGGGEGGGQVRPVLSGRSLAGPIQWVWPSGRRAFALTGPETDEMQSAVSSVDLDSGEEIASADLPFSAYVRSKVLPAVDDAGGRMFIMEGFWSRQNVQRTQGDAVNGAVQQNPGKLTGAPQRLSPTLTAVQGGNACVYGGACASAVWEVDARTLQAVKRIPVPTLRLEGLMVAPDVWALEFVPPRGEQGGKLLLVVADGMGGAGDLIGGRLNSSRVYVMQLDVASGTQEWTYRVEACKSTRTPSNDEANPNVGPRQGAAAVFLDPRADHQFVYVVCSSGGSSNSGTVVRVPLDERGFPPGVPVAAGDPAAVAERLGEQGPAFRPAASDVGGAAPSPDVFVGPENAYELRADPVSGRVLMSVVDGPTNATAHVVWVFDALNWRMLGTVGVGPANFSMNDTLVGWDTLNGRLYVLIDNKNIGGQGGGLYLIDYRRTPLSQSLYYPEFEPLGRSGTIERPISVVPGRDGTPNRLLIPNDPKTPTAWVEVIDAVAFAEPGEPGAVRRTLDVDEAEGVTSVALDGAARGFGARALLIGGVEAAVRLGPFDPLGNVLQWRDQVTVGQASGGVGVLGVTTEPYWDVAGDPGVPCGAVNREVVLGFVGPRGAAVVDAGGSRGNAEPVVVDSATAADGEAPVSRCGTVVDAIRDWDSLWAGALFGRPPVAEPSLPALGTDKGVECVSSDEQSASSGDPVAGSFAARVECSEEEASGFAYTRGFAAGVTSVGEALSSFRIYRDPGRGIVSRVEAVSRGIAMDGLLRIDTVRGTAESWANGRAQPVAAADREAGYEPNCDMERTAGSCFTRNVFGVWTPGYSCGPCGDEAQLVERMNKGFGSYGSVRFRQPDPVLAAGSEDGFTAAVQKPDSERFADLVLNSDLLQTVVPSLEIVRYAPPNRVVAGGGPRGRQVYQFAGVEVSSSYAIACLLVYDEEDGTCAAAKETPGSITVSLSDNDGEPLAGGAFELREDVDADGVLGLKDTLLPDGACVTAEDGVGTCTFEGLQPGTYLVSQVAAPPGYAKSAEPWVSEVASGEQRTVAFTNVSNVSTIDMTVTDENGAPLSGATFAAYPDPDADGKVAPDAQAAAECTTDAQGVCSMQVPAGSYVLVQTGAPGGLEGIEPVAFTFASGGQVAAVTVVNYPPSQPAAPEGAASPPVVDYSPPVGYSPPVESIDDTYVPADSVGEPAVAGPSVPEQIGGTVVRVIRAPGDALRLFARDPQQAVAFTAALALLVLALLAVRRRQLLGGLTAVPAVAFTGGGGTPPRPSGPSAGPGPSGGGPGGSGPSAGPGPSGGGGPGRGGGAATAVRERPVVAGGAPAVGGNVEARVLLASSNAAVQSMVRKRFAGDEACQLVGLATSLEELRDVAPSELPDVLLVDLALPAGDGDLCAALSEIHPSARTVALIPPGPSRETLAMRGYMAGIAGLLVAPDDIGNGQLSYTVRSVAGGKRCYGPTVQAIVLDKLHALPMGEGEPDPMQLTPRELEVARLAAKGLKRSQIARELFVSHETVKVHLRAARAKLAVVNPRDHAEVHARLAEAGLLDDQGPSQDPQP